MNRLLMETEGKYSGYKHHPDYQVGKDTSINPKKYTKPSKSKVATSKSKALVGKKKSFSDMSGASDTSTNYGNR